MAKRFEGKNAAAAAAGPGQGEAVGPMQKVSGWPGSPLSSLLLALAALLAPLLIPGSAAGARSRELARLKFGEPAEAV